MGPRPVLAVSLTVACGLHALILLVPRFAGLPAARVPTIELTLQSTQAARAGRSAEPVAVGRAARAADSAGPTPARREAAAVDNAGPTPVRRAAAAVLPVPGPAAPAFPERAASSETGEASLPPSGEGPGVGAAGANDQALPSGAEPGERAAAGADGRGTGAAQAPGSIPAHPKADIHPTYPRSARRAGLEGIVRIMAYIDESGTLVRAEVISSSGHAALDKAALQEVQRAQFEPAFLAGKPIPWHLIIPVRFTQN